MSVDIIKFRISMWHEDLRFLLRKAISNCSSLREISLATPRRPVAMGSILAHADGSCFSEGIQRLKLPNILYNSINGPFAVVRSFSEDSTNFGVTESLEGLCKIRVIISVTPTKCSMNLAGSSV